MSTALQALGSAMNMGGIMDAFWLCRSALEAKQFVTVYGKRTPHAEQNIRDGISMEGARILQEIGKAWLDGSQVTFDLEDHGQFYTVDNFWDCECDDDYIKARPNYRCAKCRACSEDQPDSRLTEVLERFGLPYEACRYRIERMIPAAQIERECEAYKAALKHESPESHASHSVQESDGA